MVEKLLFQSAKSSLSSYYSKSLLPHGNVRLQSEVRALGRNRPIYKQRGADCAPLLFFGKGWLLFCLCLLYLKNRN